MFVAYSSDFYIEHVLAYNDDKHMVALDRSG